VPVPAERLIQWQCSAYSVSGFVVSSLGLRQPVGQKDSDGRWKIGTVFGDKRSQMLCFEASSTLTLVVGNSKVPLAEFIEFHDSAYSLDAAPIQRLADSASTADDRYTPSNTGSEARKIDTQAMYESWRKEYHALRKKRPDISNLWHSQQIAKMDIARNKAAETIRQRINKVPPVDACLTEVKFPAILAKIHTFE
jgi:hypothetical protein